MPSNCKPKKCQSDSDCEKEVYTYYRRRDSCSDDDEPECKPCKPCKPKPCDPSKCREKNCSKCKKSNKPMKFDAPQVNVYHATTTAAQSIPSGGVNTVVTLDTALFDSRNNFILSSSQFQPRVPGYYSVNATVGMRPNGTATNIFTFIRKNGTTVLAQIYSLDSVPTDVEIPLLISAVVPQLVYMNGTTDYLEVVMRQNTGNPLLLVAGQESTYFTAFLTKKFDPAEDMPCTPCGC